MADNILRSRDITTPETFALKPDADARRKIADDLGILGVKKLMFNGEIAPHSASDLRLDATLGATVVQTCVVTLEPVTTRIDTEVSRTYLAEMPELPEGDEVEMPEDDSAEPLPAEIDFATIMTEALSLALPEFPRAEGVNPVDLSVTEPGKTPLTEDDVKPFAALKSLREKLGDAGDDSS